MTLFVRRRSADTSEDVREVQRKRRRRDRRQRARGLLQGVLALLRPQDVVYDCGANVGDITVQLAATGAQVRAFEPDPLAFDTLRRRVAALPNVNLWQAAVGLHDSPVPLYRAADFDADPASRTCRSTVLPGGNGMSACPAAVVEQVDLIPLLQADIARYGEISFLKLDIEGAEIAMLQALDQQGVLDHVRLTVVETHAGKFPALRDETRALRAQLAERYPPTKVFLDWL
jgi:FkbM family methyltransferase